MGPGLRPWVTVRLRAQDGVVCHGHKGTPQPEHPIKMPGKTRLSRSSCPSFILLCHLKTLSHPVVPFLQDLSSTQCPLPATSQGTSVLGGNCLSEGPCRRLLTLFFRTGSPSWWACTLPKPHVTTGVQSHCAGVAATKLILNVPPYVQGDTGSHTPLSSCAKRVL